MERHTRRTLRSEPQPPNNRQTTTGLGGRLHHISMVHANRLPNFLSFPPNSVLHPGFWNISCGYILHQSRILGMSSGNSMKLLVSCGAGRVAYGGAQVQRQEVFTVLQWQEAFETCSPTSSGNGTSTSVPMRWCCAACEPCREQAEDINSECFSYLGSWAFRTRIPQRTHTQLYGTMCGILESFIRSGRRLRSGRAELEMPLRAAVRNGDVLLADDREANKAWCVDRQELFLYLTSQLLQDKHTWTFRPGLRKGTFAHFSSPSLFLAFLAGYVQDTKGSETFVLLACFHLSNPSVSCTLELVGVGKLGIPV